MTNVFMVDSNESTIKEVLKYFNGSKNVVISDYDVDGNKALDKLTKDNSYDVVVLNPLLPTIDGISILSKIEKMGINKKVIIYSDYYNEYLIKSLSKYNIAFFLLKSVTMEILEERIIDASKLDYQMYEFSDNSIQIKISKLLHDLGMPSHIRGYQYIRDAIEIMHNNPKIIGSITKEIYPFIANKYDTTSSRVERAMRHAIEVSWNRGDYDLMDEIFGHSVDFDKAKPTNSEFLATLADKILLEDKTNIVK